MRGDGAGGALGFEDGVGFVSRDVLGCGWSVERRVNQLKRWAYRVFTRGTGVT